MKETKAQRLHDRFESRGWDCGPVTESPIYGWGFTVLVNGVRKGCFEDGDEHRLFVTIPADQDENRRPIRTDYPSPGPRPKPRPEPAEGQQ